MILSSLYYGNISPTEDALEGDMQYKEFTRKVVSAYEELNRKLTKEQMELVDKLHDSINKMDCYEAEAQFKFGFTLGVLLMQEVNTSTQLLKN